MNRDDINRMAWKAGKGQHTWEGTLEEFAKLVAAAEREAIAKMFDGKVWAYDYREIAAAIRERGGDA